MKYLITPRPSSQHKGDLFAPEGQRAGNKRQRQEIKGEGVGEVIFVPQGQRTR